MHILYMNQGGGGQWGALRYANYDLILLAESTVEKQGFSLSWQSHTHPEMSIQQKSGGGRLITEIKDLDVTAQQVRPMVTFTTRDGIRVVFVHLKSGNVNFATDALAAAINAVVREESLQSGRSKPILWIGDFNRADDSLLKGLGAKTVFSGGGQSWWDLDRAYLSGDGWQDYSVSVSVPATAGADHGHAAIGFDYRRK